jgi:hypothetical protein
MKIVNKKAKNKQRPMIGVNAGPKSKNKKQKRVIAKTKQRQLAKPVALSDQPITTYVERADAARSAERETLKAGLKRDFEQFTKALKKNKDSTIEAVNLARHMGQQIELFFGHEKLAPGEFQWLAPSLASVTLDPTGLPPAAVQGNGSVVRRDGDQVHASLEFAKGCLALHRKFPDVVTNYAVAAPELERLMVQLQLLDAPSRQHDAGPHSASSDEVQSFLADVVKTSQGFVSLASKLPVERWKPFYISTLVKQGRPFYDLYERALKMQNPEVRNEELE